MAKKVSENDIQDMTQDWGLDTSNNLPYSGAAVQKFIKETFGSKMGYFHYDASSNRYLCFADEASKDKYVANPTMTELVLGAFDAPFNYEARLNLLSDSYVPVLLGATGNYVEFTFDIVNKSGASTGEAVNATWTFIRGNNKQTLKAKYRYGQAVSLNVDKYLAEGTNNILISIVGENSLAATSVAVTYQVVNLSLSSDYNISNSYNLETDASAAVEIPFTVSGYGTKTVEWFLDGVKLPKETSVDEVTGTTASRTKAVSLAGLSHGRHSIQLRAYTIVDGETFYSQTLYRDVIVHTGADYSPIIALGASLPSEDGIVTGNLALSGASQYIPYNVDFAVFNPLGASVEVVIAVDGVVQSTVMAEGGVVYTFTYTPSSYGTKSITFTAGGTVYSISLGVEQSENSIEQITDALELDLQAVGKSNASTDKDSWEYGEYKTSFNGFEWNMLSGWNNGALLIPDGASIDVNIAPLAADVTSTGKTMEFEFATTNVSSDDAVVCDLRDSSGTGILITASEVTLYSAGGKKLGRPFKSGENIRVGFVINKHSGATNKGMAFVYINGIVSGSVNFDQTDNFLSSATVRFAGTEDAEVVLRSMRFYNAALSHDQMLNNYILYRRSVDELMAVYDRNNIYEDGTDKFSIEKLANQLPVMIVTGDIPALEETTDKNKAIVVDVEYINYQKPELSFKMTNAQMQPQGTSSMGYPKKNFRLYTQERDDTKVFDANGEEIASKLYSFREGAIPVNCWCMKADYAESSGTHNTGVARLWNDVMKNMKIDDEFVCRTEAQKAAIANGYQYDVRTTVDGFPILMFYRLSETSDLVFIGKYNFNNDKSTESVFGFKDIPGFDNSRMQCWEVLNNGDALALFTDVSDFDARWKDAFESRYPDTKTPDTADLKAFSVWMNGVSQNAFATEKWQHLDVYKMAAYYIYVMRFGAVDQTVKNSMLTSEDGQKFYFINYDNDTINGLRNDGLLIYPPTMTRQTLDDTYTETVYAYAGHDSRLWNCLEADAEFMSIVQVVDNALYNAGLTYANVIDMFDNKQAGKWAERIYNQDAQYKYVGPYAENGTNNLFMLQGSRSSHRRWWLSKRFSFIDSLFVSGEYKANVVEAKLAAAPSGLEFSITAGIDGNFGYGVNNVTKATGVTLDKNERHTFSTDQELNVGDPLRLYAAPYIGEFDFSNFIQYMSGLSIAGVNSETLGTNLKKLVIGVDSSKDTRRNTSLTEISGLQVAERLEELNIEGYEGITGLSLDGLKNLKTLKAKCSGLTGVTLPDGSPVSLMELPSSIKGISLSNSNSITRNGIVIEGGWAGLSTISIKHCYNLTNDWQLIRNWYNGKTTEDSKCSLVMEGVNWTDVEPSELIALGNLGVLKLKGRIALKSITLEEAEAIQDIFGENCFKHGEIFITAPDAIFLSAKKTEILEGESLKYSVIVISSEELTGTVKFNIASGSRAGVTIDENTGLLTSVENGAATSTLTIRATYIPTVGMATNMDKTLTVVKRVYPENITILGETNPQGEYNPFTWSTSTTGITGNYTTEWSLTGDVTEYYEIYSQSLNECIVRKITEMAEEVTGILSLSVKKVVDGSVVATASFAIVAINPSILFTSNSNPELMACMYSAGLAANERYMTKEEAAMVTETDLQPGTSYTTSIFYQYGSNVKTFDEFEYFVGVSKVPAYCFYRCRSLKSVKLPGNVTSIEKGAFEECSLLESIELPRNVASIGVNAFSSCSKLKEITINDNLKNIGLYAFQNCKSIERVNISSIDVVFGIVYADVYSSFAYSSSNVSFYVDGNVIDSIVVPDNITKINGYAFYGWKQLKNITLHNGITSIGERAFALTNITSMVVPNSVTTLGIAVFSGCKELKNVTLGSGLKSIGSNTFSNTGITGLIIPDSVETIKTSAVGNCSALSEITIGSGVTEVGVNSFGGCSSLKRLIIKDGQSQLDLTYQNYSSSTGGEGQFYDCPLEYVYIGRPLTWNAMLNYGGTPFGNSPSLKEVVLGGYSKDLKNSAFSNNKSLEKVVIGESVVSLGAAFNNCTALSEVVFNSAAFTLTGYAFRGCTSLVAFTGNNISEDGRCLIIDGRLAAFAYAGLETYSIPSTVTSIGSYAMSYTSLNSVTIPSSVTSIGNNAFAYNDNIVNMVIPDSVTDLGTYAFCSCQSLQSINIPESVTELKGYLFSDCVSLKSIIIPANVISIGNYVFGYCKSLSSITCNRTVAPSVTSSTFGTGTSSYTGRDTYSTRRNKLYVPEESIGYDTSYWLDPLCSSDKCGFSMPKPPGVYIQHVNGALFSESEWTAGGYANSDANGVAVLCSDASFVIAKQDASSSSLVWNISGNTVPDIVTSTSSATAVLDFDGAGNTPKIIEYLDSAPAAEACAAFTFPNGKKGYFPALGEWQCAYNNKTAVVSAMNLIGGTAIKNDRYYSSTQYPTNGGWVLNWNNGSLFYTGKYNDYYVRAFAAL